MNYLQQFENMLSGLDDSESKTSLVSAFDNVKKDFGEAITGRDTVKGNLRDLQTLNSEIGKALGFESEFSAQDVASKVAKLSNSEQLENLKADLTSKYEGELTEVRGLLDTEKDKNSNLTSQLNDLSFSKAMENDGLLSQFSNDPRMRGVVETDLKSKLLFEDGNIYVNDGNGGKAKDIATGNYLTPKSVVDGMIAGDEWKGFLSPQTQGRNGSGMSNQANGGAANNILKRSEMSHQQRGEYIKEHGQDAYLKLQN